MRDIVRQSLAVLNERQRLAVLLNQFEGLGYAEIGALRALYGGSMASFQVPAGIIRLTASVRLVPGFRLPPVRVTSSKGAGTEVELRMKR